MKPPSLELFMPVHDRIRFATALVALPLGMAGAVAAAVASTVDAGPTNPDAAIRAQVAKVNPDTVVGAIKDSPIPGLKEATVDGQILYFTHDAKYLLAGDLIEVAKGRNLTEEGRASERASRLAESPQDTHIVFGPKDNPKKVYVFTDTSCHYCQLFHKEVPALVAAGITVEYLAWPRGGPRSPALAVMQSVWCASDRAAAYELAIGEKQVTPANCESPVRTQWELGMALQVEGTPSIYTTDGRKVGGYVPAAALLEDLQ